MSEGATTNASKPQPRIGSYLLLHSLGSGGMSSVFKAVHVETGHEVAVKVLPRALAKNSTLLQRFIREAKSAESLEHPNIVSIYDRGVDQGRHYLVLEYVEGGDLHDRVRQGGPMGIGEAVAAIRSIATGLQYAASQGLIHRDIKPANLLMTPSKLVKIIDLGLALQAESEDERVTREGTTVGTVDYMSPEQARDSRATSERSDIYSLGCTFYFLLTGFPPFPGGDIADKLSRHCSEPPPDSRKLRPEIPGPVALLIRRMMAKRPENRFANYAELMDELDVVPTAVEPLPKEVDDPDLLFALVDEGDEGGDGDTPTVDALGEPVFALIDEDDNDPITELSVDRLELLEPEPKRQAGILGPRTESTPPIELTMAELASLDDPTPVSAPLRRPTPAAPISRLAGPDLLANALLEEELDAQFEPSPYLSGSRTHDDTTKKLVLTYTLIGLGLIVFIIGVHQLYLASLPTQELEVERPEISKANDAPEPVVASLVPPAPPRLTSIPPPVPTIADPRAKEPVPALPWVEPDDPVSSVLQEPDYGLERERRFIPAWARTNVPDRLGGHFMSVKRVVDPRDPSQKHALKPALEATIGGTIELADSGPFFEDDLRIRGDALLIRAREGYRPIVCIEPGQLDVVRGQPALIVLEGKSLVLEGLDLVVNVQDLPLAQTALFLCRGGNLTLSRCTVTIQNPYRRPFSLVRTTSAPRPSRVRIEQSIVRGASFSALTLNGGSVDVVLTRTVVASGGAPLIQTASVELDADRTILFNRSVLSGRGSLLEVGNHSGPGRPRPIVLRALGTTFAQLAGEGTASLMVSAAEEGRPNEQIRWAGAFNVFAGWHNWMSTAKGRVVKLANLSAARNAWPDLEAGNREDFTRWRIPGSPLQLRPAELAPLAVEREGSLSRVASPSPYLLEKTFEPFNNPTIPRLAIPSRPLPTTKPELPTQPSITAATPPESAAGEASSRGERELAFNLAAAPWNGDLGLFLRDQVRKEDRRLRVLVSGNGSPYSTPIQLPVGLSLEIHLDPSRSSELPPVIWSPVKGSSGEALIDVRGGDLVLTNVRLSRDGSASPKHLIRVDAGHLILNQCWLTAPGTVEQGGGDLIWFRATSTEPRPEPSSLFQTHADRPMCLLTDTLLMTGGDAIRADVGRGFLSLSNCAMAVGGSAFDLRPAKVARDRFEAGLAIDRCTLTAEESFVSLGRWPGSNPGPDRPWLVTTKDSVFLASYDRSSVATESVLLRAEPDSLARGSYFWQSSNDAFDVTHFTALAGIPPMTPRRPDVHRQWVNLWGANHIRNATGPLWPKGSVLSTQSVRFYDRLQSRNVSPADLELDPTHHPGRPRLNVGADLLRLQIGLRKQERR
ncbi:serine/threonine protein kinase [Singulisphaera sp. GP187]|uniref:serine/threonine-protein kinase n=1 Tax=Singulisphaera sp. GP187 TaxID=1882752 RepID=UPI0009290A9E|nr:serine/threonine-protein kinase [Singulisphaera sp. GP187]SIO64887.1 serine/threonine protein kinase [Singulisphaera sp. GP187]